MNSRIILSHTYTCYLYKMCMWIFVSGGACPLRILLGSRTLTLNKLSDTRRLQQPQPNAFHRTNRQGLAIRIFICLPAYAFPMKVLFYETSSHDSWNDSRQLSRYLLNVSPGKNSLRLFYTLRIFFRLFICLYCVGEFVEKNILTNQFNLKIVYDWPGIRGNRFNVALKRSRDGGLPRTMSRYIRVSVRSSEQTQAERYLVCARTRYGFPFVLILGTLFCLEQLEQKAHSESHWPTCILPLLSLIQTDFIPVLSRFLIDYEIANIFHTALSTHSSNISMTKFITSLIRIIKRKLAIMIFYCETLSR